MEYLYLNFINNYEKGSNNWDDFYTQSLKDQYVVLQRKLGGYAPDTLQKFITTCFPFSNISYYISMPGFDRQIVPNRSGQRDCLYNIVIRPEKSVFYSQYIPSAYDIILIGDVTFGTVIDVTVKGIELIDSKVAKYGEKRVYAAAACAFANKTFTDGMGKSYTVPAYGVYDMHSAVLTRDFVDKLCKEVYSIPNPIDAISIFDKWKKYVEFRKYYLAKQSERCERISNVSVCDSFLVTKDIYRRNEETLKEYLLDGVDKFGKGDQIILSRQVDGADSFPLIRVDIRCNRKEILSETTRRNGKGQPKYESHLQRYTKESMELSSDEPKYDDKGNYRANGRSKAYLLGERYLFAHADIEPNISAIEKKRDKDISSRFDEIDVKYSGIVNAEVDKFIQQETKQLEANNASKLNSYISSITERLSSDVLENSDKEVKREFDKICASKKQLVIEIYKKAKQQLFEKRNKLKKGWNDKEIAEIDKQIDKLDMECSQKVSDALSDVSLKALYESRNARLIAEKQKSLVIILQREIESAKKDKHNQVYFQYKNFIAEEKSKIEEELRAEADNDIADKIENETIRQYQIYFRPNNANDKVTELKKDIDSSNARFLTYDNRAEKAKIDRQEKALNSLLGGFVKNPYLALYLFAPQSLSRMDGVANQEPEWCLDSLNDSQKLAVRRALASESIFLLQGPPGTGKTQVIAEITAQLAKQGKKILISSETHKAIDNVFERLPKIPEIRPLRLIPSQNGKETNYSPERLVDNFYLNISGNLKQQVNRFENFNETKETFNEKMKELRVSYDKLLELKKENSSIDAERNATSEKINSGNADIEKARGELFSVTQELDTLRRTIKNIENFKFEKDGTNEPIIDEYIAKTRDLLSQSNYFSNEDLSIVSRIVNADISSVKQEMTAIFSESFLIELQSQKASYQRKLQELRNPDTDEAPLDGEKNYSEYKRVQSEFINLNAQIKEVMESSSIDIADTIAYKLVSLDVLKDEKTLRLLPEQIMTFKLRMSEIVDQFKQQVEKEMSSYSVKENSFKEKIIQIQIEVNRLKQRYDEIAENISVAEYDELNSALKRQVNKFFKDFAIVKEYDPNDMESAFSIIRQEWNSLENDFSRRKTENETKIPIYRNIVKYLSSPDILEEDRRDYTRDLFDNVNVFGITCTSRDRFTKTQLAELGEYGIESVDIRSEGIDVVIIDEVSKSSFLDLLIPILYGKTVILVGDHRQLPPMYDLKHLRESDFEGLDENIISKGINDEFANLYEECFFKTLYESVSDDFRVMLNKQYRCHSHIMEVFNHFYGGNQRGLTIGKAQQDVEKEHGLTVKINGSTVIDSAHHTYFVDCEEKESSAYEGSTSKINEQEANVVMALLKEMDKSANELVKTGKVRLDKDKNIDERLSVGVICAYGDQASLIKNKRKYQQFNGFSQKNDEKLIISTVDDFQGDERDVIIVSMVRNPSSIRFDAEFIKKFERINVAFSRARKMLIVVGAKDFLTKEGIIDLPDLTGNHALDKHNFPVYKEIIETINYRGRILSANDIIGG